MNIIRIPKGKSGSFRTIYVPNPEEKAASAQWVAHVSALARRLCNHVQHGFTQGRSPVTNAMAHRNWRYTMSFDLKDFFDTVQLSMLMGHGWFSMEETCRLEKACFYDGAARQGLPSSPAIANLAAAPLDDHILRLNKRSRLGWMFAYTRYADDLTFSFNYPSVGVMLQEEIPKLVTAHGFEINPRKTHLQCARQGRRHITGVAVADHALHVPRSVKRRLRAIRHQLTHGLRGRGLRRLIARQRELKRKGEHISLSALLQGQHRGLTEWSKLTLPAGYVTPGPVRNKNQNNTATARAINNPQPSTASPKPYARKFSL